MMTFSLPFIAEESVLDETMQADDPSVWSFADRRQVFSREGDGESFETRASILEHQSMCIMSAEAPGLNDSETEDDDSGLARAIGAAAVTSDELDGLEYHIGTAAHITRRVQVENLRADMRLMWSEYREQLASGSDSGAGLVSGVQELVRAQERCVRICAAFLEPSDDTAVINITSPAEELDSRHVSCFRCSFPGGQVQVQGAALLRHSYGQAGQHGGCHDPAARCLLQV